MQVGVDIDIGNFRNPRPYRPKLTPSLSPGFEVVGHRDLYAKSITQRLIKEVAHGGVYRCVWDETDACGNVVQRSNTVESWDPYEVIDEIPLVENEIQYDWYETYY